MVAAVSTDEFVREHDGWTRGIAASVAREVGLRNAIDDLVGYAFAGLLDARARYSGGPVPFQGFAFYRVRGAVLDGAYRVRGLSRRGLVAAMQATDEHLEETGQTSAPPGADRREHAVFELARLVSTLADSHALAMIADEHSGEAAQIAAIDRERIRRAVAVLPERERIVLEGIYYDELPLDDVGTRLGLSRSWASRLHTRALGLLRESLDRPVTASSGGDHGSQEAKP